jgi:uncharacterized protein YjbI with pentapeptide repeats
MHTPFYAHTIQGKTMTFAADEAEIINQTFHALRAEGQELYRTVFQECRFNHASLREAKFHYCAFEECTFDECDLSLMDVQGSAFSSTTFTNCKLLGVNWATAATGGSLLKRPFSFHGCDLSYATFIGLALPELRLVECAAREADFSDADLRGANFRRTLFDGSRFQNSNLTKADFRGATGYAIDVTANTITQARFSLPEAMSLLTGLDIRLEE